MINQGDRVRFLNNVGGGTVTRVDRSKNLVFVEDEDGFEVPVLERECVVVPEVNENTNFPKSQKMKPDVGTASNSNYLNAAAAKHADVSSVDFKEKPTEIFETPDGENLNALIAFIPQKIKEIHTTDFDLLLVNDSNYFLFYTILVGEEEKVKAISNGRIEPNMQELITGFDNRKLELYSKLRIQLIAFKMDKVYLKQDTIDCYVKFDPIKFLKLHSYSNNEYFDEPAMIYPLKNKV